MANDENLIPAGKGEIRNPKGKPKGTKNRSTIAKEVLSAMMDGADLDGIKGKFTVQDLMTFAMAKKAIQEGDVAAYKAIMDSAFGTPKQTIENTVTNVEPPKISFLNDDQKQ